MFTALLAGIMPNYNKIFFDLFNAASADMVEMAKLLSQVINNPSADQPKVAYDEITKLKQNVYDITHKVFAESGKALVSPFERNDMCNLSTAIDDVAGRINTVSRKLNLYNIDYISEPIVKLAGAIIETTRELDNAVRALNNLSHPEAIIALCDKIKLAEYHADLIYNDALAYLNDTEKDAIQLIKYKEILIAMETVTDSCEDATVVIETILLKNS
ncbi:DUF47 family protein [Mucilaginibacter gynuensis]|uniref:DUF47 family protein n=1 Tax=Mucilaginibacter gynuensis TaxID=1302236 RepID=A0ABP8H6A3_9SPHI